MKILKNALFIILCVIVFVVVLIVYFLISSQRLIQKSFEPLQVEWNDTVGTAYKDITYLEFSNSGHGMLNDPDKTQAYVDKANEYLEQYFENK